MLLAGGVILWTSPTGTRHPVLPATALLGIPEPPTDPDLGDIELTIFSEPYTDDELLFAPTWWERFIGEHVDPTPEDLTDPQLHQQYRQHQAIQHARDRLQPAPF